MAGEPIDAGYCHCRLCRRSAGVPAVPWGTFAREAFALTRGRPKRYASSRRAFRRFCGRCGTQLTFQKTRGAKTIDVTIASLDRPEAIVPEYHIWMASRVRWFDTKDDLPRHRGRGPDALA